MKHIMVRYEDMYDDCFTLSGMIIVDEVRAKAWQEMLASIDGYLMDKRRHDMCFSDCEYITYSRNHLMTPCFKFTPVSDAFYDECEQLGFTYEGFVPDIEWVYEDVAYDCEVNDV